MVSVSKLEEVENKVTFWGEKSSIETLWGEKHAIYRQNGLPRVQIKFSEKPSLNT